MDELADVARGAGIGAWAADPFLRSTAAIDWVRDRIAHTVDHGHDVVTYRASDVLREGTGFCFAKSHLLVALLRANGIRAGFAYQRLALDSEPHAFCLHGLAAVDLPG